MPRSASVLNIVAATPAWLRIPTPTTLILATSVSVMIRRKPITSLLASKMSTLRARSARGTVKVTSVSSVSFESFWMIMSTLIAASARGVKMLATAPGLSGTRVTMIFASFLSWAMPVMS